MKKYYLGQAIANNDKEANFILIEDKAPYYYDWFDTMPTNEFSKENFTTDYNDKLPKWVRKGLSSRVRLLGKFTRKTLPNRTTHPELFI